MSGLGDGDLGEGGPGLTGGVSPVGGARGSPRTTSFRDLGVTSLNGRTLQVSPFPRSDALAAT